MTCIKTWCHYVKAFQNRLKRMPTLKSRCTCQVRSTLRWFWFVYFNQQHLRCQIWAQFYHSCHHSCSLIYFGLLHMFVVFITNYQRSSVIAQACRLSHQAWLSTTRPPPHTITHRNHSSRCLSSCYLPPPTATISVLQTLVTSVGRKLARLALRLPDSG